MQETNGISLIRGQGQKLGCEMATKPLKPVGYYSKESPVQQCSAVRGVKDGHILVHYHLATQFETEVLPVVAASKEQEPQPPMYHPA